MKKGVRLLQGMLLSYLAAGILLFLFACLIYKMNLGDNIAHIGIIATYIISTVIGGIYIGKKVETKRGIWGILFGIGYVLLLMLAAMLIYHEKTAFSGHFLTVIGICLAGSILGTVLS